MDEQNVKPKRKQNVIRFPSSKWERRRILRESTDVRVRAIVMLRLVCGWLLIAAVFLFLVSNYRIFTPSSIRSMASYALAGLREREGDITTINYENGTIADGALFENGLAYADSDSLFLEKPGDMLTMRHTIGFTSPVVETCGDYVLVYDRGGTQATLANSLTADARLDHHYRLDWAGRSLRPRLRRAGLPHRRHRLRHERRSGVQIPVLGILYRIGCAFARLQDRRCARL